MEPGRRMEAVDGIFAGKPAGPQVQIGQVNVIVEEKRVPPKSRNDRRGDNSASRTFLRSL
jgi:hypothetical protein